MSLLRVGFYFNEEKDWKDLVGFWHIKVTLKCKNWQISKLNFKSYVNLNKTFKIRKYYFCMSLCMQWPLRNFYTFHHLFDSYRNTISKWAVGFMYGAVHKRRRQGLGGEGSANWQHGSTWGEGVSKKIRYRLFKIGRLCIKGFRSDIEISGNRNKL